MVILFTCTKCDTRSAKAFSRSSYEKGIVIVTCPGCNSRHLIADNLGWFGDKCNIEQLAAAQGQTIKKVDATAQPPDSSSAADNMVTPQDIAGWSKVSIGVVLTVFLISCCLVKFMNVIELRPAATQ